MDINFEEYVQDHIKEFLPIQYQDAILEINHVLKANDQDLIGLTIRNNLDRGVPYIYLNEYEDRYEAGESLESIMKELASFILEVNHQESSGSNDSIDFVLNYDQVKPMLALRLCDPEKSEEFLKDKPYKKFGNLAITYRIQLKSDENVTTSSAINNKFLKIWGIDKDRLHKNALEAELNRSKPILIENSLSSIFNPNYFRNQENLLDSNEPLKNIAPMYLLTNEQKTNGACAIVHKGILNKIGKLLKSNFYILPSSIHEVMIVPSKETMNLAKYDNIVADINRSIVSLDDTLSDHAMFFDRKHNKLKYRHFDK